MSPTKSDSWGKQIRSSPPKNGAKRKLVFKTTAKVQFYDLKAVHADGAGRPVWNSLDRSTCSRLALKYDKAKYKSVVVKLRTQSPAIQDANGGFGPRFIPPSTLAEGVLEGQSYSPAFALPRKMR